MKGRGVIVTTVSTRTNAINVTVPWSFLLHLIAKLNTSGLLYILIFAFISKNFSMSMRCNFLCVVSVVREKITPGAIQFHGLRRCQEASTDHAHIETLKENK